MSSVTNMKDKNIVNVRFKIDLDERRLIDKLAEDSGFVAYSKKVKYIINQYANLVQQQQITPHESRAKRKTSDSSTNQPLDKIIIYTDGGCRGNPGIGGWGAWLRYGKHEKKLNGAQQNTTNNRMELMACIKALESLKLKKPIDLYTDSRYVKDGITQWIIQWKKKDWKRKKQPVKNADLWKKLDKLNQKHQVSWFWVKGHSGQKGNDIADLLANQAMDNL